MTELENKSENEASNEAETLREKGARIAAMVEEEATAAETEIEPETVEDTFGMPCPICGGNIDLPDVPPQDSKRQKCPTCHGFGMTVTGSLVPEKQIDSCSDCQGRGWIDKHPVWEPTADLPSNPVAEQATDNGNNEPLPTLVLPTLPTL